METTEEGWVTDPGAISTIVAIGEVRVGDEIIVHQRNATRFTHESGTRLVVDSIPARAGQENTWDNTAGVIVCGAEGGLFAERNIIAWRRPKKDG